LPRARVGHISIARRRAFLNKTVRECTTSKIYVLHENDAWTAPLFDALAARDLPYEGWHLVEGRIMPTARPSEGGSTTG
jgi:hypothetical protein